ADIVFVGKVVSVKNKGGFSGYNIIFKRCVIEKGKMKNKRISVFVPCLTDPCCGINFEKGKKYRVYALKQGGELKTNLCTETTEVLKKRHSIRKRGVISE